MIAFPDQSTGANHNNLTKSAFLPLGTHVVTAGKLFSSDLYG
jgi:hypothetical protein